MRRPHELIRQGRLPLAQVAVLVAYAKQNYFTRRYRLVVGITPARHARLSAVGGAGQAHAILAPFRLSLRI